MSTRGTKHEKGYEEDLTEYEQCQFCDKIFEKPNFLPVTLSPYRTPLEKHIVDVHEKMKVRKGNNYKWMDKDEIEKLVQRN